MRAPTHPVDAALNAALAQPLRRVVVRRLDPAARALGQYTSYGLDGDDELVGMAPSPPSRVRRALSRRGYQHQGVAAVKTTDDGRVERASLRRVPASHAAAAEGRPLADWDPRECQFHVHLFGDGRGNTEVHCHYELRPDFFGPEWDRERVGTHYRPAGPTGDRSDYYVEGAKDPVVANVLDEP